MKKCLVCILVISMLVLCSCKTNISTSSDDQQVSEISTVETEPNDDENKSTVDNVKDDSQNRKTVINVDSQSAKMSFRGSNDDISTVEKEYSFDKISAFEKYTKENMSNKNFNILGIEYKDIKYYQSEKNQYRGEEYDIYQNEAVKIHINSDGIVTSFLANEEFNIFSEETKPSEQLAKKYLDIIIPKFKYDAVRIIDVQGLKIYSFSKSINGIRTSDCVGIALLPDGSFGWYTINDVGKYDNIEIKNFNIDDFLQRVDKYVEDAFGDVLVDYRIFEDGPCLSIFTGDKVELAIPIVIDVKDADDIEYSITEDVVFELN